MANHWCLVLWCLLSGEPCEANWVFARVNGDRSSCHLSPGPGSAPGSLLTLSWPFTFTVSLPFNSSGNFLWVGTNYNTSVQCSAKQSFQSQGPRAVFHVAEAQHHVPVLRYISMAVGSSLAGIRTRDLQRKAQLIDRHTLGLVDLFPSLCLSRNQ